MIFSKQPSTVQGLKFDAGNLIMGINEDVNERIQINLEESGRDIERKVQTKMFEQPNLNKWGIFFAERDSLLAK
jgi:hypothetical protein